jgi:membrane protein
MPAMFKVTWVFTKQTWIYFSRHNCPQQAAAISYYVLFSIIPLVILAVSIIGFVLVNEDRRSDLVNEILDTVPLTRTEGRDEVESALDTVQRVSGPAAALSVVATVWASSAMFSSIRRALNIVWGVDEHRPWAQGKLVDFMQVGVLTLILLGSIALTGFVRAAREASGGYLGPIGDDNALWEIPTIAIPALVSFATFALLYRIVPAAHPNWRPVLPGALFATVLFEALKNTFAIYVANFNNFDVVYGSLAGVLLFLFFTYLASNILLAGAELSHTFDRYFGGELEDLIHPKTPQPTALQQLTRAMKGLFVRQP